MEQIDRREAEDVLRRLSLGTQIVGVRWTPPLSIEIEPVPYDMHRPDLLLQIESRFAVFPEPPETFPDTREELRELSVEESVGALLRLAGQQIVGADLGERYSHLILSFESGSVLFVNGYHPQFESWTVMSYPISGWTLVSIPGGDIAVWTPHNEETEP